MILESLAIFITWVAATMPRQPSNEIGAGESDRGSAAASAGADAGTPPMVSPLVKPAPGGAVVNAGAIPQKVDWVNLIKQELRFVAIEHSFRLATEPGTRSGGIGWGRGYWGSIGRLHGWDDGDPFYVNYLGHPIQGSVAGYIWLQNDAKYRRTEFGRTARYWKARLRSTAFAWAQSEQFEIGPFSEASIGHIQRTMPQQGLVDHAITPVMGLAWTLAEDALDRYVIKALEARTQNVWLRLALRTGLNPTRGFANLMALRAPWSRDTRAGVRTYSPEAPAPASSRAEEATPDAPPRTVSTFELAIHSRFQQFLGSSAAQPCIGGGASGALRVAPEWMMVLEVAGCKLTGLEKNLSGDSLSYLIGPRWTPAPERRWSPYVQVLVGGNKITHEGPPPPNEEYARPEESSGFSLAAGTGLDFRIHPALVFRVASLEYSHSHVSPYRGMNYASGVQVAAGMVLRVGTW